MSLSLAPSTRPLSLLSNPAHFSSLLTPHSSYAISLQSLKEPYSAASGFSTHGSSCLACPSSSVCLENTSFFKMQFRSHSISSRIQPHDFSSGSNLDSLPDSRPQAPGPSQPSISSHPLRSISTGPPRGLHALYPPLPRALPWLPIASLATSPIPRFSTCITSQPLPHPGCLPGPISPPTP